MLATLAITVTYTSYCSVILYIHAPVHIYGVTYYSTTTTSDVVVAITLQDPGT